MANSGMILPHSNMETHRISRIDFGLLNPDEIKNMAVVKVESAQVTDQTTGNPIDSGINDLRMGTVDKVLRCKTCDCNFADCPGHFGYIELVKPMYHIGFIETCRKILRCVCFNCSKLLVSKADKKFEDAKKIKNPKRRQNAMFKLCSSQKKCRSGNEKKDVIKFIRLFVIIILLII
jgi:DNA-directed RNA polymerase II subunit RPB1